MSTIERLGVCMGIRNDFNTAQAETKTSIGCSGPPSRETSMRRPYRPGGQVRQR